MYEAVVVKRFITIIIAVAVWIVTFSTSAQSSRHARGLNRDGTVFCMFSGSITKADVQKLSDNLKSGCTSLSIDSPGGDVDAALDMGRLIRRKQIDVQTIADSGRCASACVFLFAAGVSRLAYGPVEIHRPYMTGSDVSLEDTQEKYRKLERKIKQFLRDMNVKESLYEAMLNIGPEDSKKLTLKELDDFGMVGVDPVFYEYQENKRAASFGFSKIEWLTKKRQAADICGTIDGAIPKEKIESLVRCWKSVFPQFMQKM